MAIPEDDLIRNAVKTVLAERSRARTTVLEKHYFGEGIVYDRTLAQQLVGEMYVDEGHPSLNNGRESLFAISLLKLVQWSDERLPADARAQLAEDLMRFVNAGGGQSHPITQAEPAAVLSRLAPGDPVVQGRVDQLPEDALYWSEFGWEVGRGWAYSACEWRWGTKFWAKLQELDDARLTEALGATSRPMRHDRAVKLLRGLLWDPPTEADRLLDDLREATELSLEKFEVAVPGEDLIWRRLLTQTSWATSNPQSAPATLDRSDRPAAA